MIAGEGHVIYGSGDTDITSDMGLWAELHEPDIGILNCGGHYTMDMKRAAYAARKFFRFKTVVPSHYRTFPLLAQNADELKAGLPGVNVTEPEVMQPIMIAAR
jgi:L-ascorbate metabolism protein UlaG (beta-lactamase superfamily)